MHINAGHDNEVVLDCFLRFNGPKEMVGMEFLQPPSALCCFAVFGFVAG